MILLYQAPKCLNIRNHKLDLSKKLWIIFFTGLLAIKEVIGMVPLGTKLKPIKRVRNVEDLKDDSYRLDFIGLVNLHGYPGEEYKVTTDDGYILTLHRMPGSSEHPKVPDKPVVLMVHGILETSDTWVLQGPDLDLAFLLVDAGYDVWLANSRGNAYSRAHVKYSPDADAEFWRFSFHEMGIYDLPAVIDFILKETNQKTLIYIGHSMGTTQSYILLSTKPQYNDKVKITISLAPVAFWNGQIEPIWVAMKGVEFILKKFVSRNNVNEVLPLTVNKYQSIFFCNRNTMIQAICDNVLGKILYSELITDETNQMLYTYFPAGSSVYCLFHFLQNMIEEDFRAYDYGPEMNLKLYNQRTNPAYNLSNVRSTVMLFYAIADIFNTEEDILLLQSRLSNCPIAELVPNEKFTHMDFVVSYTARELLYDRILNLIAEYGK